MKRQLLTATCIAYVLLALYGSLMPFDFSGNLAPLPARLHRALHSWPEASRSDLGCNFLLYLPLGFLAATWLRMRGWRRAAAVAAAAVAAAVLSVSVETAQLFLPDRLSQIHDVVSDSAGGLVGAVVGGWLGRRMWLRLMRGLRQRWSSRPAGAAAALMCLMLVVDGWGPLLPVRSRSELHRNLLRESQVTLDAGLAMHPWHRWLVCRIGVFAVLAALLGAASRKIGPAKWLHGAAAAVGVAIVLEIVKPFVVNRGANVANVVTGVAGAMLGMVLAGLLAGRLSLRAKATLAVLLIAGYAAYREWTPLVFTWSLAAARAKVPAGADWLPLANFAFRHHDYADIAEFLRNAALMVALAYAAALRGGWMARGSRTRRVVKGALVAGALGLGMEAVQHFIPGRGPDTGNALAFLLGGAIGAYASCLAAEKALGSLRSAKTGYLTEADNPVTK